MTQLDFLPEEDLLATVPAPRSPEKTPTKEPTMMPEQETLPTEDDKAPSAFRTISETASFLGVPQHVLRFWESRFSQIKPLKMRGGRRYYRPEDIEVLATIKTLLYKQGYTIKGAKKAFGKELKESVDAMPPADQKPAVTEKQKSQLTVIRHELMALRDTLKPYVY